MKCLPPPERGKGPRRRPGLTGLVVAIMGLELLTSSLVASPAQAAGATSRTLAVAAYRQEQSNWCWAASAQMIQMARRGVAMTQCAIVKGTLGLSTCPNVGASDAQVRNSLNVVGLTYTTNYAGLPPASVIKGQVDTGKPLEYDLAWTNGGKHAVVIIGYYYDPTDATGSTIYWNDPLTGTKKSGSWSYLASNPSWTASFTVYGIS